MKNNSERRRSVYISKYILRYYCDKSNLFYYCLLGISNAVPVG